MKTFKKPLAVIILLIFFSGCQKNEEEVVVRKQPITQTKLIEEILSLGYSLDQIEEFDDFYIVDGDIEFSKEESYVRHITSKQSYRRLISENRRTISIYLNETSFNNLSLSSVLNDVINEFNEVNSGIQLYRSFSSSANIQISNKKIGNNICGTGQYPVFNRPLASIVPGKQINIDEDFVLSDFFTWNYQRSKLLLAHEIGHTLGFAHTNWRAIGDNAEILVPGTTENDPGSIMNGRTCGRQFDLFGGFSSKDKIAIKTVYPLLRPKIDRGGSGCSDNYCIWILGNNFDHKNAYIDVRPRYSEEIIGTYRGSDRQQDIYPLTGQDRMSIRLRTARERQLFQTEGLRVWVVNPSNGTHSESGFLVRR